MLPLTLGMLVLSVSRTSLVVGALLILYQNAEYLVAVIRAIDVTTVQPTLIITLVLAVLAAIVYAISFTAKKKA